MPLLDKVRLLLLDFDGPVCSVFAQLPAQDVATRLRDVLRRYHVTLPPQARRTSDPWKVWEIASKISGMDQGALRAVVDELLAAELEAVSTAQATPNTDIVLRACHQAQVPVVIVSNNSADSIDAYFNGVGLRHLITDVAARTKSTPHSELKPSPYLLNTALTACDVKPHEAVMVGDSRADMQAAGAASVRGIGFVNKAQKQGQLLKAGALREISCMGELLRLELSPP